jgi:hypothetical protein
MLVSRYQPILYLQYLLLLVDLGFNAFAILARHQPVVLLVLCIIQDICILFAVIVIFLLFFNTYIFQAGLVNILIAKFKTPILIVLVYLGLTIGLHVWGLTTLWNNPLVLIFTPGYVALYVIQRTFAVLYYYTYKRTALRLSDPRFYQVSDWIIAEFEKKL